MHLSHCYVLELSVDLWLFFKDSLYNRESNQKSLVLCDLMKTKRNLWKPEAGHSSNYISTLLLVVVLERVAKCSPFSRKSNSSMLKFVRSYEVCNF